MSKRRRRNKNSEQGCEVILIDSGARPTIEAIDTSWVDVPDDRSEGDKEQDFCINILKDSEDDYVDAPDETKSDFGTSYDSKMGQILEEVSESVSDSVEEEVISSEVKTGNKLEPVLNWVKRVKTSFEPASDKEPATLGGTILIILLLVVAFIMIVNLCSVMGRLPVQKVETPVGTTTEVTDDGSVVEVIDSSNFKAADGASFPKKPDNVNNFSEVGKPSGAVLDESGKPIVDETVSSSEVGTATIEETESVSTTPVDESIANASVDESGASVSSANAEE